jgi:hypothetical protein
MPSTEDLHVLDGMSRDELIARARALGAKRPELMTRVELRDEIVRLTENDPVARKRSRGWLGVARDLVASVVDAGLNMPSAAAAIRGGPQPRPEWQGPAPVATVTLAEIYVAQGHTDRALAVLDELLLNEPDHVAARALRTRLSADRSGRGRIVDVTASESLPEPAPPEEAALPAEPASSQETEPASEPLPAAAEASAMPLAATPAAGPLEDVVAPPACALAVTKSVLAVRYELEHPTDGVTLRLLSFVPRREGPERLEIDVPVDAHETSGGLSLPPPTPGAVVRAILGVGSNGGFRPLVVAWVYDARGPAMALAFGPPGKEPRALRANLEAAIRVGTLS